MPSFTTASLPADSGYSYDPGDRPCTIRILPLFTVFYIMARQVPLLQGFCQTIRREIVLKSAVNKKKSVLLDGFQAVAEF